MCPGRNILTKINSQLMSFHILLDIEGLDYEKQDFAHQYFCWFMVPLYQHFSSGLDRQVQKKKYRQQPYY